MVMALECVCFYLEQCWYAVMLMVSYNDNTEVCKHMFAGSHFSGWYSDSCQDFCFSTVWWFLYKHWFIRFVQCSWLELLLSNAFSNFFDDWQSQLGSGGAKRRTWVRGWVKLLLVGLVIIEKSFKVPITRLLCLCKGDSHSPYLVELLWGLKIIRQSSIIKCLAQCLTQMKCLIKCSGIFLTFLPIPPSFWTLLQETCSSTVVYPILWNFCQ